MTERKPIQIKRMAVVGDGSAATAALNGLERRQTGLLQKTANTEGIAWVGPDIDRRRNDRRPFGAGKIADYLINGNSDPGDFIEGTPRKGIFARLWRRGGPGYALQTADGPVHLAGQVAPFLQERAEIIREVVDGAEASHIYQERATRVELQRRGRRIVITESGEQIHTKNVVLATGAKEKELAGFREAFGTRYKLSGEIIAETGTTLQDVKTALQKGQKITFVAASHSTYAAIAKFLQDPDLSISQGQIVVISRREPLIYFKDKKEAQDAGYKPDWNKSDWDNHRCRKTKKINRFGGLRNDAKMAALDTRITFVKADGEITPDHEAFVDAAYVVSGIGYETNPIEIYNKKGKKIDIITGDGQVEVDRKGRVLKANGRRIKHVYGIGLGYGQRPSEEIGGEPSFEGRLDGVNVQDTLTADRIIEDIFREVAQT